MYLDDILAHHRALAKEDHRDADLLISSARAMPPTRGFRRAIVESSKHLLAVIAEIKRRSPSKGDLNIDLDPAQLARDYEDAGATCLSVLTDEEYFGGSRSDLEIARRSSTLPVIRKDFIVSVGDVCDSRLMGADCILLIASALTPAEMVLFFATAVDIGLDVLVEVHNADELERSVELGATLIGVNQRDLATFEVDHTRARQLVPLFPSGVVKVAESGVRNGKDARVLRDCGFDAVLVGESLLTSENISASLQELQVK